MNRIIARLLARCAYVLAGIVVGGLLISNLSDHYSPSPAYVALATHQLQNVDQTHPVTDTTKERVIVVLPHILQVWTSITLAWGVFVGLFYSYLVISDMWHRESDIHMITFLWAYNVAILMFLCCGGKLNSAFNEAFTVLVIFYAVCLTVASLNIIHWWWCLMTKTNATLVEIATTVVVAVGEATGKFKRMPVSDATEKHQTPLS